MRILIVDDSRAMRLIIRRLVRRAGYGQAEMREAADGEEAIDAMSSFSPDLVLTDWHMPGLSGLELLARIRAMDAGIHVGMITSQGTPVTIMQAREAGADFLLTKPLTSGQLSAALGDVFAEGRENVRASSEQRS